MGLYRRIVLGIQRCLKVPWIIPLTLEQVVFEMKGSWPYPQTLDKAGKACGVYSQHLKVRDVKSFVTSGPGGLLVTSTLAPKR